MRNAKEKLLFVTRGGEAMDEGFSYVLDLAKTLNAGIAVLMVYKRRATQTYEDAMAAVAFAEAGEHKTVKEIMETQVEEIDAAEAREIGKLTERCRESSVPVTCNRAQGDMTKVIEDFIRSRPSIEMVFLSPGLLEKRGLKDIKRLLRKISRPVVTLTRPEAAGT